MRLELDLWDHVRIGFFDFTLKVEFRLLVDEDRRSFALVDGGDVAETRRNRQRADGCCANLKTFSLTVHDFFCMAEDFSIC